MTSRIKARRPFRRAAAGGIFLAALLVPALSAHTRDLVAREGHPPAVGEARPPRRAQPAVPASRPARVAAAGLPDERFPFPRGEEEGGVPYGEPGQTPSEGPSPMPDEREPSPMPDQRQPSDNDRKGYFGEVGTSLPWEPGSPRQGDWRERVRRRPAPIPEGRPLPYYPPEPPASAPPGSAVLGPPDFIGSAAGYLEIPVGQTGTLLSRGCRGAALRSSRAATIVSRESDRVLIRGLFPGRTLLDVEGEQGQSTYIVQVR